MRNIVIGDVHGAFDNLRKLLIEKGAINEDNERINKDSLKVYCSGDLIDGGVNREGDMLILEHAEEWFDRIAIGNHEWAFLGGPDFGGARAKDRELMKRLLRLEERKVYVPAFLVENFLVIHAGLAKRWGFRSESDALDAINFAWEYAEDDRDEVPMFDAIGQARAGKWGASEGGIFWLDWSEIRNRKINQIVGHSTFPDGPLKVDYPSDGTEHWNIDVGGKTGLCLGGVEIENGVVEPFFWGQRFKFVTKEVVDPDPTPATDEEEALDEMYFQRLMEEEVNA